MAQLDVLQQQLLQLQAQLHAAVEEKKQNDDLQYKGKSMKVKLTISDKEFITNSDTLFHKQHGNTLFIQTHLNKDESAEGGDNNQSKSKQPYIHLEFDRDPDLFQYIINFLRGYNLQHKLRELTVVQLEKLKDDAAYYQIKSFHEVITNALYGRFNPYLGSPLIELSKKSTVVTRTTTNDGLWQSVAIYGTVSGTTSEFPGCAYYCYSGDLYRSNSNESWGANSGHSDRIGALVKLNKESNMATVAFFKNGALINKEINLKNYMNVDKGVVFMVLMENANDQVQLVQNPVMPQ